uniref:GTPase, putative n=1 Tax=Theileria annulata TaxID=5874 RepID=A0A3B0MEA8_THEAN
MYNSIKCARASLCRILGYRVRYTILNVYPRNLRKFTTESNTQLVESKSTLNAFGLPETREFFVPGITTDPFYKDISLPKRCIGCGAQFQTIDQNKPGYVCSDVLNESGARGSSKLPRIRGVEIENAPEGVEVNKAELGRFSIKKRRVICQRCYKLQYYKRLDTKNEVDSSRETLVKEFLDGENLKRNALKRVISSNLTAKQFPVLMTQLESETNIANNSVKISSTSEIISNMATRIKNNSLILFVLDLTNLEISVIPELYIALRNRTLEVIWIANKIDVLPKVVDHSEIKRWLKSVVRHIGNSKSSDVILISSSKGTGFDKLEHRFKEYLRVGDPRNIYVVGATNVGKSTFVNRFLDFIKYKHVGTLNLRRSVGGTTRSAIPGTTLEFIEFGLPSGFKLIDTPGIPIISQIPSLLYKPVDLISIAMTKTINPLYIKLDEGQTLLIGALGRVDLVQGSKCIVQCFFACTLIIEIGPLQVKISLNIKVTVNCNGPKPLDEFVICGLGWFSFSGTGPKIVEMFVPKGVNFLRRPAMITNPPRAADKFNIINQR